MKLLCIQLARLGDILLSAPALHAYKRENPDCQIEILVRPRFKEAADLFSDWLTVRVFDTGRILTPILEAQDSEGSLRELQGAVDELRREKYDVVFNMTFSPFSSYLTKMITNGENTRGYTRFSDNTFAVKDFTSGYFYSQVGIGRPNRLHITDIMSGLSGASLQPVDFELFKRSDNPKGIVLHVGASQKDKALSVDKLVMIVSSLQERGIDDITLVGSVEERPLANQIVARTDATVKNLCGRTTIRQLKDVVANAALVIGADSAPMHFATLAGVPCLNLSFPTVNFFETGPRSEGSRILFSDSESQLLSHIVANEADAILNGRAPALCIAESHSPIEAYFAPRWNRMETEWSIIKLAYFRLPFSVELSEDERRGVIELKNLNVLILSQLMELEKSEKNKLAADFISQAEMLIEAITRKVPTLSVLLRWLQASRATVGPGSWTSVLAQYKNIHIDLANILDEIVPSKEKSHGNESVPAE